MIRYLVVLAAVAVPLLIGSAPSAHAAVISVDTTADELVVDGNCSLREAIQAANTDTSVDGCAAGSGADSIALPAGTYAITIPGRGDDANLTGDFDIAGDLTITGAGAASTIVDAAGLDRAFHILGAATTVEIDGVTAKNGAPNSAGGGILTQGVLTLSSVVVTQNTTDSSSGGGIYNSFGTLILTNSAVSNNTGGDVSGIASLGSLALIDSTVSGNSGGTGIVNFIGTLSVTNSTVSGNSSDQFGGGIRNQGALTIANSTVTGNTTVSSGGGIFNQSAAAVAITSSTISRNSAFGGGGLANPDPDVVTLKNTIVAYNTATFAGGDCSGAITSLGHNLSSDNSCAFSASGDLNSTNPNLGSLANNGGPTQTEALLSGSPAVDAGSSDCPPPFTDQRGMARAQDGDGNGSAICDIGAFEADTVPTPTPTGTATSSPSPTVSPTDTPTPSATATNTSTPTNTRTPTNTPTPTFFCFAGETQISTPDGQRRIDQLAPGDVVLSFDHATGRYVRSTIETLFARKVRGYLTVKLSDGTTIRVTEEHPFFDPHTGAYRAIKTYRSGDVLAHAGIDGLSDVMIVSVDRVDDPVTVYNLHVADENHNYVAGGVLVHNKTPTNSPTNTPTKTPTNTLTPTRTSTPTTNPSLPDLIVLSMSINLENYGACNYTSTALGLHVTVKNQGNSAAGTFVVNANGTPQTVAGGLAAGATTVLFYPSGSLFGTNAATADSTFLVIEGNESNNTLSEDVAVPTLPPTCTPTATNTPTPTGTVTNTPTMTAVAGATQTGVNQAKSCDPNETSTNVGPGPSCNLFICQVGPCAGAGEGDLVVIEHVNNVQTNPNTLGLGAYEFQVEFDSLVIQSVNPTDIIFTAGCSASLCGTAPSNTNAFAALGRGAPDCTMTILFENSVRFGCVTHGQAAGPLGSFDLAKLDLIPSADDVKDLFPGNDNGMPTLIKDNQCELADTLGHPVVGSVNGAGLLPKCGDIYVTVRILEGDLNLDCVVDLADEALIAEHYGSFFGSALYQKWFDLEPKFHDLDIDIKDLQKVFGREGSNCQNPIPAQTPVAPPFSLAG